MGEIVEGVGSGQEGRQKGGFPFNRYLQVEKCNSFSSILEDHESNLEGGE